MVSAAITDAAPTGRLGRGRPVASASSFGRGGGRFSTRALPPRAGTGPAGC